ncbi:MAG: tRNA pseudouridine38-40 synthase [Bdellovibrionota bacterium]|jgi:tRNA pseudouridine38-40 synthase
MHHHFLLLAYDGTDFRGWQRQPGGVITVQQTLEEVLSKVHHREVVLGGCGRTDAGVHATQFYAYLQTDEPLPMNYRFFVNKQLPAGISLLEVIDVNDKAQARYDATERTYDYFFHNEHASVDPFQQRTSAGFDLSTFSVKPCLDALKLLIQYNDFRAFCKTPDRHNTTIVHFTEASLFRNAEGTRYRFRFRANRFLRGMIRLLVNDLVLVGKQKLSIEAFEQMLKHGERTPHFRLAPPEGLFLTGVKYPYIGKGSVLPVSGREEWTLEIM